ncbi:hypothetical protein [Marinobacter sp.]|uniref:hypothetical protein n=1 Tax=Marinobacter sp. TaxID=50741 RepID=UPI00257BF4AA|nr:hypothetical protein [Marinobacter sp.]|tara:strand:+ start:2022 stop:2306 length:285 start_codon:yes stop_codon:yes gene_type:complete
MSTRLKLSESVVINADEIVSITTESVNKVLVINTTTSGFGDEVQGGITIEAGSGKAANLAAAMNTALLGAPSGRLIKVPAGDYTVGAIGYATSF